MRPDDLHQLLRRQPFQPFRLHLSNGRTYDVRHPELVLVGRSSLIIGTPAPEWPFPVVADYDVVALLHINDVKFLPAGPAPATDGAAS